jgi:putative membrane protein
MVWNRKETRSPNRKASNSQEQASTHEMLPVVVATDIPVPSSMESSVDISKYDSHALVQSMMRNEQTRNSEMEEEGKNQMLYTKSTDGWIPSLFMIRGRALDWIWFPWAFISLHGVAYTVLQETIGDPAERNLLSWEIFFGILLNSTLSFLLVFRLNRAAGRYWTARFYWGDLVAKGRTFTSGLLCHGNHNPIHRDRTIQWIGAFAVCAMEFLRGIKTLNPNLFAGILSKDELRKLEKSRHPPLYAIDQIRLNAKEVFRVDAETPLALAHAWTQQLDTLEKELNVMMDCCGGMERIRATPLPLVYVAHLRTFLMIALILLPYVLGPSWGWGTIPVVFVTAFALLGIEAAAAEVESPFGLNRVNALNMNGYCRSFLSNIQQQITDQADREIETSIPTEQSFSA